jgi:3-deoxy-manno-octulosonate cytidylyltransferase (CMP-KDO synthetase)
MVSERVEARGCLAVIPARYGSTRLPGKPLRTLCGKPLIRHVYERAQEVGVFTDIVVATDCEEIRTCVHGFGGRAVMTSSSHRTGTDRVAEVCASFPAPLVVNIQGDEPMFDVGAVAEMVRRLSDEKNAPVATLKHRILDRRDCDDPNVVKVVTDTEGYALYFSRSRIPFAMKAPGSPAIDSRGVLCYKHIGIYAFRRDFLLLYAGLPPTRLEQVERLEQLRILEHGHKILVLECSEDSVGVDTEEDLKRAEKILLARGTGR